MPKTGRENWGEDQHLLTFFRAGKKKAKHFAVAGFSTSKACRKPKLWSEPRRWNRLCWEGSPGGTGTLRGLTCAAAPLRSNRGGAGGGRGGERDTHRPKLPFSGCSERREEKPKHRIQPETHPRGRAGYAQGCGGGGGAGAFPPACRAAGNPPARREAGVEDARASPGAYKWLSTDQVLCSCSVRGKAPAERVHPVHPGPEPKVGFGVGFWCSMSYTSGQPTGCF